MQDINVFVQRLVVKKTRRINNISTSKCFSFLIQFGPHDLCTLSIPSISVLLLYYDEKQIATMHFVFLKQIAIILLCLFSFCLYNTYIYFNKTVFLWCSLVEN